MQKDKRARSMQNEKDILTLLAEALPGIAISMLGGFVRLITAKNRDITIRSILAGIVTSGFVGVLLCLLMHEFKVSMAIQGFVIGVGGYAAEPTLNLLKNKYLERLEKID